MSITVSVPDPTERCTENQGAVGVDLGINAMATLSNGDIIPGAKPHTALLGKLRRLSRSLSRKVRGSIAVSSLSEYDKAIPGTSPEVLAAYVASRCRQRDRLGDDRTDPGVI